MRERTLFASLVIGIKKVKKFFRRSSQAAKGFVAGSASVYGEKKGQ